ncbi:beta-ketoacyl synthase N-terminal-like domain-containing protein [Bacillus sp. RC252]|uniref:beta-ketoacyl synthase N-terminal-like domain-containing protein n=1 Tax=Bacillus sp. RC252 TaxID=3156289 RepID=UPI0038341BF1
MKNCNQHDLFITGVGVSTAIGQGKEAFTSSLMQGNHAFGYMKRPGRQKETSFIGAEISSLSFPDELSKKLLRKASLSGQIAMMTLHEAWKDANLDAAEPERIGLIIGGSNIQQREMLKIYQSYQERALYIPPTHGITFMDSDLCGLCTEQFGIRGLAYTVGGASASGQLACIQAIHAVLSGQVDICISMGALMDISYLECQAFRGLGAMGTDRFANKPDLACRPFDKNRDGFIFGESCGAIVIERRGTAESRKAKSYTKISGWAVQMDSNRNPNPSSDGEMQVIQKALEKAGLSSYDIDYINPHGSGSVVGDETEIKALEDCQLSHAFINATKSITGHGLSAAGIIEVIATVMQMKESRLHPTRNLEDPISPLFHWVRDDSISYRMKHALSLSIGFGGINTAICLENIVNT